MDQRDRFVALPVPQLESNILSRANMFSPGYYSRDELESVGFASLGEDVRIARNVTIIGLEHLEIGDHVRIDGYVTLSASSAGFRIGRNVHIGAYCALSAGAGLVMEDFSGLSQGVKIFTRSDDYSGDSLTNPTVPARYTRVRGGAVNVGRHVIVGAGSVIMPGVKLAEGAAVGALSLVVCDLEPWTIYAGVPAKALKPRAKNLLQHEAAYLSSGEDQTLPFRT